MNSTFNNANEMNNSELFRKKTHCIFALKAAFWIPKKKWNSEIPIEENVEALLPSLNEYILHLKSCINNKSKPIDSFVIESPAYLYSKDMDSVAEWLRRILYKISPESINEIQGIAPDLNGTYKDTGWNFTYKNISFFVLTTTPLYGSHHSRFCGGQDQKSNIIHLQPMYSFEYHFSNYKNGSAWDIVEVIRNIFKRFGRDYKNEFSQIVSQNAEDRLHEAPKYLKPANKGDAIIKWWIKKNNRLY